MLIVGGALAFTAIGVFFAYRFIQTGRALLRERKAKGRHATKDKSDIEKVGAE